MRGAGEVSDAVRELSIAFPNLDITFWSQLLLVFRKKGFCKERLDYIVDVALTTDRLVNQYRFNRLCIADFTSITEPLTIIPNSVADNISDPDVKIVSVRLGKETVLTYEQDAIFACLEYKPWKSTAQKEIKAIENNNSEEKISFEDWQKELEKEGKTSNLF